MNLSQAAEWLQSQNYLKVLVSNGSVTITNGVTVEVTGDGLVDAVTKVQTVLKQLQEARE